MDKLNTESHLQFYRDFMELNQVKYPEGNTYQDNYRNAQTKQLEEAFKIFPKKRYILMVETFKMIIDNFDDIEVMIFYSILKYFNRKHTTVIFDINTMFNCINTNLFSIIARNGKNESLKFIYTYTNLDYKKSFEKIKYKESESFEELDSYELALKYNNTNYSKILLEICRYQNNITFNGTIDQIDYAINNIYKLIVLYGNKDQILLINILSVKFLSTKTIPLKDNYTINYKIFKKNTSSETLEYIYTKNKDIIFDLMKPSLYGPIITDININNIDSLKWIIKILIRRHFRKCNYLGMYTDKFNAVYHEVYNETFLKMRNWECQEKLLHMSQEEISKNPEMLDCFSFGSF